MLIFKAALLTYSLVKKSFLSPINVWQIVHDKERFVTKLVVPLTLALWTVETEASFMSVLVKAITLTFHVHLLRQAPSDHPTNHCPPLLGHMSSICPWWQLSPPPPPPPPTVYRIRLFKGAGIS